MEPVEDTNDQMRIAIDVCTDLEHGDATITACQLEMIRLWKDHWRLYGSPRESLDAKGESDFFGKGRHVVVVEDQISHGRSTIPYSARPETAADFLFAIVSRRRPTVREMTDPTQE